MFEIVKKIFYFTSYIIYEFQLSLMKSTEPVATAGTCFINQSYLGEEDITPTTHLTPNYTVLVSLCLAILQ